MLARDFLAINLLRQRLLDKLNRKIRAMNQALFIRDMVVYPDFPYYFGETKNSERQDQALECDLILLSSKPTQERVSALPIFSKMAYVLADEQLFYVNQITAECVPISLVGTDINQLIKSLKAEHYVPSKAYLLSSEQLECIASHTDHRLCGPAVYRLMRYIDLLATMTNTYHQTYYCEKKSDDGYQIKEDCLNKITRLSTHEFSLYTKDPLNGAEFSSLIDAVYQIAKRQHSNVHLLLSSFAVLTNDNKILNVSLYVQCGSDPVIETFCKGRASPFDVSFSDQEQYKYVSNFSQQDDSETVRVSAFVAPESNQTELITNHTVFLVKTSGGGCYVQCIDVCFDHKHAHSRCLMNQCFERETVNDILPEQVDHILTSNCAYPKKESYVSESLMHIDPILSKKHECDFLLSSELPQSGRLHLLPLCADTAYIRAQNQLYYVNKLINDCVDTELTEENIALFDEKLKVDLSQINRCRRLSETELASIADIIHLHGETVNQHMREDKVKASDLTDAIHHRYSDVNLSLSADGICVEHSPFGSDFMVLVKDERQLSGFHPELKPLIEEYNRRAKYFLLEEQMKIRNESVENDYFIRHSLYHPQQFNQLKSLYRLIVKRIKINFLEKLFKTRSYRIKKRLQEEIKQLQQALAKQGPIQFAQYVEMMLPRLKSLIQGVSAGIQYSMTKELMAEIDQTDEQIRGIRNTSVAGM